MKKILLLIVLFTLKVGTAQAQTFNERYLFGSLATLAFNVLEYKDTIVVQGVKAIYLPDLMVATAMAKISEDGAVLDTTFAVFDSMESNFSRAIDIKGNKIYSFGHGGYGTSYFSWGTIMQMDQNLKPLWIKKYRPVGIGAGFFVFLDGAILKDGSILVMGRHTSNKRNIHLIKLDSLGNQLWEKVYKEPYISYDGMSLLVLNDSTYLIGLGFSPQSGTGAGYLDMRNVIIKTDSSGNLLSTWVDEDINGGGVRKIVGLDDGGLLFVASHIYKDTTTGFPNSEIQVGSKPYICRLDSNFNKIWEQEVGNFGSAGADLVGLYDVIQLADGDYLGVGITGNVAKIIDDLPYVKRSGLVVKFTADGAVLWERHHNYFPDYKVFSIEHFYSVIELSNGSLVACGESDLVDLGKQEAWVVKMFSNGMIDSVNQVFDISGPVLSNKIHVYPNPASDFVEIEYESGLIQSLQIFDVKGRIIYSCNPNQRKTKVEVLPFEPGTYIVLVNGSLVRKFVVSGGR